MVCGERAKQLASIVIVFSIEQFQLSVVKGKYHANCCHFKTQKCLSVSRNNEIIVKFVINYHPSVKTFD